MDVMVIPPDMWPFALLGWSGSKQYLRFMRQHAGHCGLNLNSHGLFRLVEVAPRHTTTAAAAAASRRGSSAAGSAAAAAAAAAMVADEKTDGRAADGGKVQGGGSSSSGVGGCGSSGGSSSLAEAIAYVRASAAAGMTKVVLSVPDEAPPLDRDGRERWPSGWSPAAAALDSAAAVDTAAAGGGKAGGDTGRERGAAGPASTSSTAAVAAAAPTVGSGSGCTASVPVAAVVSQQRAVLAGLVRASSGSSRVVVEEGDICALLGVPYRPPQERCG